MKLVIIAAGEGSRIRSVSSAVNKTLLQVGGRRILDYLLENAILSGLDGCIVVTGYRSQAIEEYLAGLDMELELETVYNPQWQQPNGISVLAAKPLIEPGEDFLVSMSDHLYDPALLAKIQSSGLEHTVANVGLDFHIDGIFDLDDGMKVSVDPANRRLITGMSKKLSRYDAIDCGVFNCRYEFFDVLDEAQKNYSGSLSDSCNLLIPEQKMGGVDIDKSFWIDIDTPESLEHCRRLAGSRPGWLLAGHA